MAGCRCVVVDGRFVLSPKSPNTSTACNESLPAVGRFPHLMLQSGVAALCTPIHVPPLHKLAEWRLFQLSCDGAHVAGRTLAGLARPP